MSAAPLRFDGVSLSIGGAEPLREVSFTLSSGAFLAVIGPNGAGKSTLLNVAMGLLEPTRGRVEVLGQPPARVPVGRLGFIPQVKTSESGFPARAIELVLTGARRGWPWRVSAAARREAESALAQAGVAHLADRQIRALSGGELQRVYLARCLLRQPALLLLDEPGAGLDMAGEAAMYHLLEDYGKRTGATVVMITHDWEGARTHATHVLLMNDGRAAFGAPDEVATEKRLLDVFGYAGHRRRNRED